MWTFSDSGLWEFKGGPVELFIHMLPGSGPSAVHVTNQPQDKGSLTTDLLACRVIIGHLIVPTDFWDPSVPRRQPEPRVLVKLIGERSEGYD